MSVKPYDSRFGIYVDVDTYKAFQEGRERLGLSENTYLKNLLGQDFTVKVRFKHVDLNQTRLYAKDDLKPDVKESSANLIDSL